MCEREQSALAPLREGAPERPSDNAHYVNSEPSGRLFPSIFGPLQPYQRKFLEALEAGLGSGRALVVRYPRHRCTGRVLVRRQS
jgi:hypothetical protein